MFQQIACTCTWSILIGTTVLSNLKNPYNILHFLHFMICVFGCHNDDGRYIWDVAHATTDERPYHSKSCAFPFVEPVKVWVLCFLR